MKTFAEINEKIRKGKAVVVTAEEIIDITDERYKRRRAICGCGYNQFGPMCSTGAL